MIHYADISFRGIIHSYLASILLGQLLIVRNVATLIMNQPLTVTDEESMRSTHGEVVHCLLVLLAFDLFYYTI